MTNLSTTEIEVLMELNSTGKISWPEPTEERARVAAYWRLLGLGLAAVVNRLPTVTASGRAYLAGAVGGAGTTTKDEEPR